MEQTQTTTKSNLQYDLEDSINKFLSHCLQFALSQSQLTQLKSRLISIQIQKSQYLTKWEMILKKQLNIFIRQTQSILNVYQYPSKEKNQKKDSETLKKIKKLFSSALIKLQFCVQQISKILKEVYHLKQWCKCSREVCPVRLDSNYLSRKLKYQFLNAEQINWASLHLQKARLIQVNMQKLPTSKYDFFGINDDMQCDLLSIENSVQKQKSMNKEAQRVIKYLQNMKICKQKRKQYHVSFTWLNKMKTKVQQN